MVERGLNIVWCLLGLGTMVNAWNLGLLGPTGPDSGLFPMICGVIIAACGLALLLRRNAYVADPAWPRGAQMWRILGVVAGLVSMAISLPYVGFAVSSAITTFVLLQAVEAPAPAGARVILTRGVGGLCDVCVRQSAGPGAAARSLGLVMDAFHNLMMGFTVIFTPQNLWFCFIGSVVGTLVGVLPGVGPLAALALLLPVTFKLRAGRGAGHADGDFLLARCMAARRPRSS